eukprot:m.1617510 g.1617510  ORF g.1617510 m.1617510 type:complete len:422 (-) comp25373_c0_seq3:7912-9177(-)
MDSRQSKTIVFDVSKRELFSPSNGYKALNRKLKRDWKIISLKDEISVEKLAAAQLMVLGGPRSKFTAAEFDAMRLYMENGGSILLMIGEGGESKFETNINFFLEEYGVAVNTDAVVRSSYYKYHHPKECVVSNGVVNREIDRAAGKSVPKGGASSAIGDKLTFVYPFGATLTVEKPSVPVLSTGSVSIPVNRPICAFHGPSGRNKGKLAVLGSCHMFQDQYLDKEENQKVLEVVLKWLTTTSVKLDSIDAEHPSIADYHLLPQTGKLAEQLRTCLQEGDEIPRDFTTLFERDTFNIDTSVVPNALAAYDTLGIEHEPLRLITPQFETPLPPLEPAVFPPNFREPPGPALDLFDLDDSFSSERVRLAQLTNKCGEDDLEYYVRECGDILGVSMKLPTDKRDGKHILEHVFKQIVEFKKSEQM